MAAPTFSKSGVATVTFSKGRFYPIDSPQQPNQIINEAEDGTFYGAELGNPVTFIEARFERVPLSDATNVFAFLNDSNVKWSLNTFTFTDEDGTTYTVRYWGPFPLRRPQVTAGLVDIEFMLRVEV